MTKKLFILGNGFDLSCGLRTKYNDFFKWRFRIIAKSINKKGGNEILQIPINDSYIEWDNLYTDLVRFFENQLKGKDELNGRRIDFIYENYNITKWDLLFLYSSNYDFTQSPSEMLWVDVERMMAIFLDIFENYIHTHPENRDNREPTPYTQEALEHDIIGILDSADIDNSTIVDEYDPNLIEKLYMPSILNELKKFESYFSNFIKQQLTIDYYKKANKLFDLLIESSIHNKNDTINVISFNYTLREEDIFSNDHDAVKEYLNGNKPHLESWRNIHGFSSNNPELPKPIFGIDNHGLKDDLRWLFTKSFRIIDNEVNETSDTEIPSGKYSNLDEIYIYGHSLGRADYSYFETIFDNCKLYDSNTKLCIYYYPIKNGKFDINEKKLAIEKVVRLLTDYGRSLNENHGDNIVNKLVIEGRLRITPNPDLKI